MVGWLDGRFVGWSVGWLVCWAVGASIKRFSAPACSVATEGIQQMSSRLGDTGNSYKKDK